MGNASRNIRGESQKAIVNLLQDLGRRHNLWEVWQDFVTMGAISIANAVGGAYRDEREKMYLERAARYTESELNSFVTMFTEMVACMDHDADQDFLGQLFMSLDLGNNWKGQFFTPYDICRLMAAMMDMDRAKSEIAEKGWIGVSDPACGAGALLLAFANECCAPGKDINYQTSVLFVAQDVDFLAGCMCYIQLSLMGCAGYVVIDDTLANPSVSYDRRGLLPKIGPQVWFTPMYYSSIWTGRQMIARMQLLESSPAEPEQVPKPEPAKPEKETMEPKTIAPKHGYRETEFGQLTLF